MIRTLLVAALALACVYVTTAEARARSTRADIAQVGCSDPIMRPCDSSGIENRSASPKPPIKSNKNRHLLAASGGLGITHHNTANDGMLIFSTSFEAAKINMAKPARYIAGRLVCAVNVNAELARRGIRGTGSALAKSFLHWGRASRPVAGAVAVYHRRGGGHVAIVSRVVNDRVYVWNPSSRSHRWREVEYRKQAIAYRVAGP